MRGADEEQTDLARRELEEAIAAVRLDATFLERRLTRTRTLLEKHGDHPKITSLERRLFDLRVRVSSANPNEGPEILRAHPSGGARPLFKMTLPFLALLAAQTYAIDVDTTEALSTSDLFALVSTLERELTPRLGERVYEKTVARECRSDAACLKSLGLESLVLLRAFRGSQEVHVYLERWPASEAHPQLTLRLRGPVDTWGAQIATGLAPWPHLPVEASPRSE